VTGRLTFLFMLNFCTNLLHIFLVMSLGFTSPLAKKISMHLSFFELITHIW
jgi:hypothetical protein